MKPFFVILTMMLTLQGPLAMAQEVPPIDFGVPQANGQVINAHGQIAGYTGNFKGFFWSAETGKIPFDAYGSWPFGINASGRVVGRARFAVDKPVHAFVFDPTTRKTTDLGTLGGAMSWANAINDDGYVVGRAQLQNGRFHAVMWSPSGVITDIGVFGGLYGDATAINARGQIVGRSTVTADSDDHAFFWDPQTRVMTDLGTLGGYRSYAWAISDSGQVVGDADGLDGWYHAFSWTKSGGMVDLGTLGGPASRAFAVNAAGLVVGFADVNGSHANHHAFAWTASEGMKDLGTLGGAWSEAYAVNATGQIAGVAQPSGGGNFRGVVWSSAARVILDMGVPSQRPQTMNDHGLVVGGPFYWIAPNVPCVNELSVSYIGGTLNLGFKLMTVKPATWWTWLAVPGPPERRAQLWSASIPTVSPARSVNIPIQNFPPVGPLYILTALTTSTGYCTDWKLIETAP